MSKICVFFLACVLCSSAQGAISSPAVNGTFDTFYGNPGHATIGPAVRYTQTWSFQVFEVGTGPREYASLTYDLGQASASQLNLVCVGQHVPPVSGAATGSLSTVMTVDFMLTEETSYELFGVISTVGDGSIRTILSYSPNGSEPYSTIFDRVGTSLPFAVSQTGLLAEGAYRCTLLGGAVNGSWTNALTLVVPAPAAGCILMPAVIWAFRRKR